MRTLFCLCFCLFLYFTANAQSTTKDTIELVLADPEIHAEFPGGPTAFMQYMSKNINTNITFTEEEASYLRKAVAWFTISETGTVENVHILKSSGVVRVDVLLIKTLEEMPKWKPAITNGKAVKQQWNFPLTICLK